MSYQTIDSIDDIDVNQSLNYNGGKQQEEGCTKRNLFLLGLGITILASIGVMLGFTMIAPDAEVDAALAYRYFLDSETGVCNDGTPAAYFIRRNEDSDMWLIYSEGSYLYCWDSITCDFRFSDTNDLMSTVDTPETMELAGIMSSDCEYNPHWCEVNVAFIKYCSSDLWTGSISADDEDNDSGYHFRGWDILTQTLDVLMTEHGMNTAEEIMYAGKGGAGITTFVTSSRVEDQLRAGLDNPDAIIKHFSDTGWISDHDPYVESQADCNSTDDWTFAMSCNYKGGISQGVLAWNPQLPDYCVDAGQTWECYFTEYTITEIESRVDTWTFMWGYDSTQLNVDGLFGVVPDTMDDDQIAYCLEFGDYMLNQVYIPSGIKGFVPDCWYHEIMESEIINDIIIDGVTFADALNNWFANGDENFYYDPFGEIDGNPTCPDNTA